MEKIIVNADQAILGRVSSYIAKELLKGKNIEVINCEKILVSGNKNNFVKNVLKKRRMGRGASLKGPKYIRKEDMFVKRIIRGMLPWDRPKGREAFSRLKCYIGENGFSGESLKQAKTFSHQIPSTNFTIKEAMKLIR